jgi:phage tail-like protein
MRGMVEGLPNPHPLGLQLPAMFQEDDFAQRFVSALDEVIAPVLSTLDCMDAYLDPTLAPPDFLPWLAGWTGADLDETWSEEQQREVLASTARLHERRGTVQGLHEVLRLATGFEPEIDDSGGAAWSPTPGADLPGREEVHLRVRVRGEDLSEKRIAGLVAEHVPAHVPWTIELESAT